MRCERSGCDNGKREVLERLTILNVRSGALCATCQAEFDSNATATALIDEMVRSQGAEAREIAAMMSGTGVAEARAAHAFIIDERIAHAAKRRAFVSEWLATPRPAPAETTKETP